VRDSTKGRRICLGVHPKVQGCYWEDSTSNSGRSPEGMVYSRITTSDKNSFNATVDNHVNRSLGAVDEDRSHGRLSRKYENDQTPGRCKFVATSGTNISAKRKYSRINHTKIRMPSSLVHRLLHRRASGN
jgi:hypothetical protein